MHHRTRRRVVRQFRYRPLHVLRRVQLADERNRPARNQRELHLGPILAGGIIHDGPPFERGLALIAENQPVARLPHRRRDHVAGGHRALPGVAGIDVHATLVLGPRRRQRRQVILELRLQLGVGEADAAGGAQVDGAQIARVEQQGQVFALALLVGAGHHAAGDDGARHRIVPQFQLQARAFKLVEHRRQRFAALDPEGEVGQLVTQRVHGIVAQAGDLAAAAVGEGQRLEHVVHVGRVEIEPRRFARPQRAGAFEEAHAVLVQDYLFHRKIGRLRHRGAQQRGKQNVSHDVSMRNAPAGVSLSLTRPSP
jgi:hypothetical protein